MRRGYSSSKHVSDRRPARRRRDRPEHKTAYCATCNARERVIVDGRCIVCGYPPEEKP